MDYVGCLSEAALVGTSSLAGGHKLSSSKFYLVTNIFEREKENLRILQKRKFLIYAMFPANCFLCPKIGKNGPSEEEFFFSLEKDHKGYQKVDNFMLI
jgi:hypothetical protein